MATQGQFPVLTEIVWSNKNPNLPPPPRQLDCTEKKIVKK